MGRRLQKSSLNPIASPPKPNNLEETPNGEIFFLKIPIILLTKFLLQAIL
jgi:hypothetical protein